MIIDERWKGKAKLLLLFPFALPFMMLFYHSAGLVYWLLVIGWGERERKRKERRGKERKGRERKEREGKNRGGKGSTIVVMACFVDLFIRVRVRVL